VVNPINTTVPILTSIVFTTQATQSQAASIDSAYSNVIQQGSYFYY
jgi:hypothetical protein